MIGEDHYCDYGVPANVTNRTRILVEELWTHLPQDSALRIYLGELAPSSRHQFVRLLQRAADLLEIEPQTYPWHEMDANTLSHVRDSLLAADLSPSTVNVALAGLRGISRASFSEEALGRDWFGCEEGHRRHLRSLSLERVSTARLEGSRPATGRVLFEGEFSALVWACRSDPLTSGARDEAMISAIYAGVLLAPEAANMNLTHWSPQPPSLRANAGAGDYRERVIQLGHAAADAIAGWVAVRGPELGPLFLTMGRHGNITGRGMSTRGMQATVARRASLAGIRQITVGDLRATAIHDLFESGAHPEDIAEIAGLKSTLTIVRYDHRPLEAIKKCLWHGENAYHKW